MGKYDTLIADAKVALTDVSLNALNAEGVGCELKISEYVKILRDGIAHLEEKRPVSVFGRLKDVMFDTPDDRLADQTARRLSDAVYQLNYCLKCKCANCPAADGQCRCSGCLFGSYVGECDRQTETRYIDNGVITVDGRPALRLAYDRGSGGTVATVMTENGTRVERRLDLKTGKSSPL